MSLTELEQWEQRLSLALNEVDACLEERYGKQFPLKVNRPAAGKTGNAKYDGLFAVDAKFTMGYVTGAGPSYVVEIRNSSSCSIPSEVWQTILCQSKGLLEEALHHYFPDRQLQVSCEGERFRITGDLNLDNIT